jgi:GntR family transcriptional regulator/MocR family aminotransferase
MGLEIRSLPVDGHGMRTELLGSPGLACVRAVYVTPSHQFPLGGILPAGRRAELIRFAREHGAYIIEDDYDSEFRYSGAPIAPMRSMDSERVIYTGTFSKTLFPALRIGFVILPEALQRDWLLRRTHADNRNTPFEQAALAEMLRTRKFDRHVQRMRRLYGQRREVLLQALQEEFGESCQPLGDAAGLHVAVQFPGMRFDEGFSQRAKAAGIRVAPAENYALRKREHSDKLILGFGHMEADVIRKSVAQLYEFMGGDPAPESSIIPPDTGKKDDLPDPAS